MNRFQQVATYRKTDSILGVGDRVEVNGQMATVAMIYCQDGVQFCADLAMDNGEECSEEIKRLRRANHRN